MKFKPTLSKHDLSRVQRNIDRYPMREIAVLMGVTQDHLRRWCIARGYVPPVQKPGHPKGTPWKKSVQSETAEFVTRMMDLATGA